MALPWKPFLSFGEMRLLGLALVGVLAPTAPIAAHAGRLDAKRGVAFRPEFQAPWIGQPHVTALALRRLVPEESGALVHGLIGGSVALSAEVVEEIIARTDGVPLFVEEMTKVLEARASGDNHGSTTATVVPATALAVPATLHASLMSRLDPLGSAAKEIAQMGAAIGREFSYDLLAAVARRTEGSCGRLSVGWLTLVLCSGAACRPKQHSCSSTRLCRTQRIARCYVASGRDCTRA